MKKTIILGYANLISFLVRLSLVSDTTIKLRFLPGLNKLRNYNGRVKAYAEFIKARRRVPGYRDFLAAQGFKNVPIKGLSPDVSAIPVTTKKNYVNLYTISDRCINGKIPAHDVVIDESSGSSGMPVNWVRGKKERRVNHRVIEFGMRNLLGRDDIFVINAFALGAWATGVNITMGCLKFSKLKSTGPDIPKILNTLKQFGPAHRYVIMGYPPFLKQLIDAWDGWEQYDISFIVGGEAMTEGMREYILNKGIKKFYSSFGASDLELNIAHENEFTISLRKLLIKNAELRTKLLKFGGAIPMVFQFNPADFYIESNDTGELIITICRTGYIAPKIRYNIYDKGHVMQYAEYTAILKDLNLQDNIVPTLSDLPLLLHYGRGDMTVSFFGSNISPNDVQETIFNIDGLAAWVHSFHIETIEDEQLDKLLVISLELNPRVDLTALNDIEGLCETFFLELIRINQDFRAAYAMSTKSKPVLKFCPYNSGPFTNADNRIKAKYIG